MTAASAIRRKILTLAFVPLLTGAAMPPTTPQPLPYTLRELAQALPAPMPTTKEAIQAFLHTSLRFERATPSMHLYDTFTPLITRDGYIIERVDVREAMPRSDHWRTDEKNILALTLTFAATPCVPLDVLRETLDLPHFWTDLSGPEPGDFAAYVRYTAWGGLFIDATNAQPDCVVDMGVNVFQPPPPEH